MRDTLVETKILSQALCGSTPPPDPQNTKAHRGPGGGGHKGDLPRLAADSHGKVKTTVVVGGLTVADARGHAFLIHAGGDNYSDTPKPLGGGGDRIACAIAPVADVGPDLR
jgi:Cu-Zn family superoxide dismutase